MDDIKTPPMYTLYITRPEYEARHITIEQRIADFDKKLEGLAGKVDGLSQSILQTSADARVKIWQFVAVTAFNFLVDGGLVGWLILSGHLH